VPPRWEVDV
jgi:hypothetical protein